MGLDPDQVSVADLMLVQPAAGANGNHIGTKPSDSVISELKRCRRWMEAEAEHDTGTESAETKAAIARAERKKKTEAAAAAAAKVSV
jgi:hypothetical protein